MPLTPGITQPSAMLNSLALQSANSRIMPDPETVASPGNTVLLQERTPVLRQLSAMSYGGWDNITQKTVSGTGQIVIPDAMPGPLLGLTVTFFPVQTGTGDPSPENVRPIIPWQSIGLTVNGSGINVPLNGPYYGGTVDLTTGVLTVEWVASNVTWADGISPTAIGETITMKRFAIPGDINVGANSNLCTIARYSGGDLESVHFRVSGGQYRLYLPNDTDGETSITFASTLVNPQTYQLDPVSINLTAGQNTISTTANGVITAVYAAV